MSPRKIKEIDSTKISLVVPTYNQGKYIQECLDSIQCQSYKNFEVIIQDSLSDDETEVICRNFVSSDKRFKYFREKDSGQSDAINRGLARSDGRFWNWICSDDYYSNSTVLEALIAPLLSSESCLLIGTFGDAHYVSESSSPVRTYKNFTTNLVLDDFRLTWPISQPSAIFYRQSIVDAQGVDESLNLGMDLDLFLKILKGGKYIHYVSGLKVNIRLQPNSKSVKFRKKTAENALSIIGRHFGNCNVHPESEYVKEYMQAKKYEILAFVSSTLMRLPFSSRLHRAASPRFESAKFESSFVAVSSTTLIESPPLNLERNTGGVAWVVKLPVAFILRIFLKIKLEWLRRRSKL